MELAGWGASHWQGHIAASDWPRYLDPEACGAPLMSRTGAALLGRTAGEPVNPLATPFPV